MNSIGMTFFYVSVLSALIPLIVGIKRKSSLLWIYVLASFSCDIFIYVFKWGLHINHLWIGNVFVCIEFLLLSAYYHKRIPTSKRLFYVYTTVLFLLYVLQTLTQTKGFLEFNSFGYSIINLVFIAYVIAGFYRMLQERTEVYLEQSSFFWVNTAFLIYASGNFLLFLFNKYLQQNNDLLFIILWSISFKVLNILKNVLLAVALSKKDKN